MQWILVLNATVQQAFNTVQQGGRVKTKTRPSICERGYDQEFWYWHEERIENGVDLYAGRVELETYEEWTRAFPSVALLDWWLMGNEDQSRGWCYDEMASGWARIHEDRGRQAHEAELTNAITGLLSLGRLEGPGVVFCDAGSKATMPRHHILHVFSIPPTPLTSVLSEVADRMAKKGYALTSRSPVSTPTIVAQPSKRISITPDLRADVWDKTRGRCWYCGVEMHPFRNFHVDHYIPVIDGGSNEIDNLVPACQACNSRKHARPAEYLRRFFARGTFYGEENS